MPLQTLTHNEILELNVKKQEALSVSKARRRNYLDNEFGTWSGTGVFSLFFTNKAFKYGWEKEQAKYHPADEPMEITKDPTKTVRNLIVGFFSVGFAITAAVVVATATIASAGVAAALGWTALALFAGAAIGGALGFIDAYFETGKLKREMKEGEHSVKGEIKNIFQDRALSESNERSSALEQQLAKLEARLSQRESGNFQDKIANDNTQLQAAR